MKKGDVIGTVFFVVLFVAVIILSFLVIQPFITALIAGALLAYISFPVYSRILKRIGSKSMSALLVSVLVIFVISIPSFLIVSHLTQQAQTLYLQSKEHFENGLYLNECPDDTFICNTINTVTELWDTGFFEKYLSDYTTNAIKFLTQKVADAVLNLPSFLLMIVLAIFTMYYLLKDGKDLFYRITDASPLKKRHRKLLVKNFGEMTGAIVYGSLIIAIIQGGLATLGYWLAGISGYLWWGLITGFFALIPFVGTGFVWFPASLYLAGSGYIYNDPAKLWSALFLFLYGLLIVSTVDNILKPYLVAGKARVHPLLVFFGVVGGLIAFGFLGILIGPILLGFLQTLFLIYEKEMRR